VFSRSLKGDGHGAASAVAAACEGELITRAGKSRYREKDDLKKRTQFVVSRTATTGLSQRRKDAKHNGPDRVQDSEDVRISVIL